MRFLSTRLLACWGIAFSAYAWAFAPGEDVEVVIRSNLNSLCLEVEGGSHADGAKFRPAPCDDVPHQRWLLQYMGEGHYLVRAKHTKKCLDSSSVADGALFHQWPCHAGVNQRWRFDRQPSGVFLVRMHTYAKCMTLGDPTHLNPCYGLPEQDWLIETINYDQKF